MRRSNPDQPGAAQRSREWTLRRAVDFVVFRTYADLRAESDRTYLGFLWWIFEPALFMAVFYLVFGVLQGTGGKDYVAMLLVGVVVWQWMKSAISHSADAVANSLFLMRQVKVLVPLLPLVVVCTDTVKFLLVLAILLAVLALLGFAPGWHWLALLPLLLCALVLIVSVGMLAAAWVPIFPDLRIVIETALLLLMFVSGVFFSREHIPPAMQEWFYLNPFALLIDGTRQILLHGQQPDWAAVGLSCLPTAALLLLGLQSLAFLQRRYGKLSV